MDSFTVIATTRNGNVLLTRKQAKAVGKKATLYAGGNPAAILHETIASVAHPHFLAQPLHELKNGTLLRLKR